MPEDHWRSTASFATVADRTTGWVRASLEDAGTPRAWALYASTHLSLACLEIMVHLETGKEPKKLSYAWTEIDGRLENLDPQCAYLQQGAGRTVEIGRNWIPRNESLAVRVPSVLIPGEDNVLLNPLHPGFSLLDWQRRPFDWDDRLARLITTKR